VVVEYLPALRECNGPMPCTRALIDLGRTDEALAILGTLDADADGFVVAVRR
jgi:hypothetical protein